MMKVTSELAYTPDPNNEQLVQEVHHSWVTIATKNFEQDIVFSSTTHESPQEMVNLISTLVNSLGAAYKAGQAGEPLEIEGIDFQRMVEGEETRENEDGENLLFPGAEGEEE